MANRKYALIGATGSTAETDPVFLASAAYAITGTQITNWDTAFSWGNHAGLYSLSSHTHAGVYEPADATILKDADIGVTVAAFSHTHSYLPLTGGTLTGDLTVTGNITAANLGSSELKYKTADETISTSSSTLQNDDHLAGFALDAGAFYKVEGYLQASMTALTVDFKAQMSFTNTPQNGWMTLNSRGDTGSSVGDNAQYSSTCILNITAGLSQGIIISGYIYANATTGGTMTLQWAKNALSLGESLTVFAGSWMKLTKLS